MPIQKPRGMNKHILGIYPPCVGSILPHGFQRYPNIKQALPYMLMSPLCTQRWGYVALPVSVSVRFILVLAFYRADGQTRDVDPVLG